MLYVLRFAQPWSAGLFALVQMVQQGFAQAQRLPGSVFRARHQRRSNENVEGGQA
ncbi:hypothetical protein JOS77_27330 [Chromobacterium haemolyticum]|nr:hypothetical protein JOS77_27330 [Chromobacterium haemolyticum]